MNLLADRLGLSEDNVEAVPWKSWRKPRKSWVRWPSNTSDTQTRYHPYIGLLSVCAAIYLLSSELSSVEFESEGIFSRDLLCNNEILREKRRVKRKWTSRRVCWSPQIWLLSKVGVPLHFSSFLQTTRQSTAGKTPTLHRFQICPLI
jgi:hypothetical protein